MEFGQTMQMKASLSFLTSSVQLLPLILQIQPLHVQVT